MIRTPQTGEIWLVDFSPQTGREQAGLRPGIVISHERFNQLDNGLHIVVPITTTDRGLAYHVRLDPPNGGLKRTSFVMCEQEKSQSVERFKRLLGKVDRETLHRVQDIVATLIDR